MKKITVVCLVMLGALAGLMTGCNNDSSSGTPTGLDVSGTWALNAEGETSTMTLRQNGDALTGSVQGVPLTGSVNGNSISISSGLPGGPLLVADGSVEGATMGGSYTATEPNGTQHTGSWSATKQ
jgi:hypothetical protein